MITGDVDPHERDQQFRLIATLRRQARARSVPVLCVDTKKKERLGHLLCDAIALAWQENRAQHYPHAQEILLTFDAGGANATRSLRFKEDLVPLSCRLGLRLQVARYPSYTYK